MLTETERLRFNLLQEKKQNNTLNDAEQAEWQRFVSRIEAAEAVYLRPATEQMKRENAELEAQNRALKALRDSQSLNRSSGYGVGTDFDKPFLQSGKAAHFWRFPKLSIAFWLNRTPVWYVLVSILNARMPGPSIALYGQTPPPPPHCRRGESPFQCCSSRPQHRSIGLYLLW